MIQESVSRVVRSVGMSVWLLAATAAAAAAQPSGPLSAPPPGPAAAERIPLLRDVGIDQRLDQQVPLDLGFVDETGRDVTLRQYLGTRPLILQLAYFDCPILCPQVTTGLASSTGVLTFSAGKDFTVLVVSIDPGDTPAAAAEKRHTYLQRYGHPGSETGIHFLTGRQSAIERLASAVGFRYAYDQETDQYAHPAAITILTPQGKVSRYLFGIEFAPRDLRLALVEAGENHIGSVIDQALLFCYHYDPSTGKYGLMVTNLVRGGGVLTVGALAGFILISLRRERRQDKAVRVGTATGMR